MKRLLSLLLALLVISGCAAADFQPVPDLFNIAYTVDTHLFNRDGSFVSKEYVTTAQPAVDAALRAIADDYVARCSPTLPALSTSKRNSRLDVNIVHSVSGQSLVSFQVIARTSVLREVQALEFTCRTYDMATGQKIRLTDLLPADSAAWDVLSAAVRHTLANYFPQHEADSAALDALCSREAIEGAAFMVGPVCLSLHYSASDLYPNQKTLMRVSVPYSALSGMMTDYGALQTDNSMYKFVALTFDDGPAYTTTRALLAALRHGGARATFFLTGDRIAEYADVARQENDENHSLQSHSMKHINSEEYKPERLQAHAQSFNEVLSSVTGTLPVMMRAPYGKWQPFVQAGVLLPQVTWDVDTKDWTGKTPKGVLRLVEKYTVNGSVILMHDICDNVAESAELTLAWLRQQGYLCVTVEELFMHFGQPMETGKRYYSVTLPSEE